MGLTTARLEAAKIIEAHIVLRARRAHVSTVGRRLEKWRRPETLHKLDPVAQQLYEANLDDPEFRKMSKTRRLAQMRRDINPDVVEELPQRGAPPEEAHREAGFILLHAWLSEKLGTKVTWTKWRVVQTKHVKPGQFHHSNAKVSAPSPAMKWLAAEFKTIYENAKHLEGYQAQPPTAFLDMADNVIRKFRREFS